MNEMKMPQYKSYKTVFAHKIAAIKFNEDGSAKITPVEKGYETFTTVARFHQRFKGDEKDLGYLVIYVDGYQSWSPTKAFEEGYKLL